jgi:hypothetical protein
MEILHHFSFFHDDYGLGGTFVTNLAREVPSQAVGNQADVRVLYNDVGHEVTAVTAGAHMLVGIRKFRVFKLDDWSNMGFRGFNAAIQTEAYERGAGLVNDLAMSTVAGNDQWAIWTNHLNNIADSIPATEISGRSRVHALSEHLGNIANPWRSSLPAIFR